MDLAAGGDKIGVDAGDEVLGGGTGIGEGEGT
jgi:hypothetical protein